MGKKCFCRLSASLRRAGIIVRPWAAAVFLLQAAVPARAIVTGEGQNIFPDTVIINSSGSIHGDGGLLVDYGVKAATVTLTGGITAASGTFTQTGAALYSIQTSSGINVLAGGVTAPFFAASGASRFTGQDATVPGVTISSGLVVSAGNVGIAGDLTVDNKIYVSGDKLLYPTGGGWNRPKRSIILTAGGAIPPTVNGAAQTKVNGTNHTYYVLNYDAATAEAAYWQWTMPNSYDGGTIDITYYWTAGVNTNNVVWCFNAGGITPGGAVDAALSADVCDTAAAPATAGHLVATTHAAVASNFAAAKYTIFKVYRKAADGADTMAGDASLLNVKIEYGVSAESD